MAGDGWSYFTWVAKVPQAKALDQGFNALGGDGWELVTSTTTVKTWLNVTGNDLVFVFKKPGAGQSPAGEVLAVLVAGDWDQAG